MPWTCRRCESINHDAVRTCEICEADVVATSFSNSVIAAGQDHSLAILPSGKVVAWGDNAGGQTNVPPWLSDVVRVTAGKRHSIALTRDNRIVGWGDNTKNQLMQPRFTKHIVDIAAAGDYSCVLFEDGTVCAWGDDSYGQCSSVGTLTNIAHIALGIHHGLAITHGGALRAWGTYTHDAEAREAGKRGSFNSRTHFFEAVGYKYTSIAVGITDSFALTNGGEIHVWTNYGEWKKLNAAQVDRIMAHAKLTVRILSTGEIVVRDKGKLIPVTFPAPIAQLALGAHHLIAITNTGDILGWGDDTFGQITIPAVVAATKMLPIFSSGSVIPITPPATDAVVPLEPTFTAVEGEPATTVARVRAPSMTIPPTLSTTPRYVAVAAGEKHSLVLTSTGAVNAYGDNTAGQATVPASVIDAVAIAAGNRHSVALLNTNTIIAWGDNTHKQCTVPVFHHQIASIAAGGYYTLVLFKNGTVGAWGDDTHEQCRWVEQLRDIVHIAAGSEHALALTASGVLHAWGRYPTGDTGIRVLTDAVAPVPVEPPRLSFGRMKPSTPRYTDISAGESQSFALTSANTLIRWNKSGTPRVFEAANVQTFVARGRLTVRLMDDKSLAMMSGGKQYKIPFDAPISQFAVGGNHVIALTEDGRILQWENAHDAHTRSHAVITLSPMDTPSTPVSDSVPAPVIHTASGPTTDSSERVYITTFAKPAVIPVARHPEETAATASLPTTSVWVCAHCDSIMAADDAICDICDTPRMGAKSGLSDSAGSGAALVYLVHERRIYAWDLSTMRPTSPPAEMSGIIALPARQNLPYGITCKHTIEHYGPTLPPDDPRNPPAGISDITQIAAGKTHVLALKKDGSVVAWGLNEHGQTNTAQVQKNIIAIAAGAYHSVALFANGTIRAWGYNASAQAKPPVGLRRFSAIAAGGSHSIALKNDGTLVAWGSNQLKQTTIPASAKNIVAIACGTNHTIALTATGTVVCWGSNNHGQIEVPTGLTDVIAVSAGKKNTLVLCKDGTLHGWGNS